MRINMPNNNEKWISCDSLVKSSKEHAYGILSLELISFMSLNPTQAVGTEK